MKCEDAEVFVLAETQLNMEGRKAYLKHLGVPEWYTDATSAAEELTEIAVHCRTGSLETRRHKLSEPS